MKTTINNRVFRNTDFKKTKPFFQKKNNRRGQNNRGRKIPSFNPSQFINKNPIEVIDEVFVPKNSFETFGLNSKLVHTLYSLNLKTPTPIQDKIIPEVLQKRDVIGLAETGTGKTAAFLLPLIENTLKETNRQTLILAPTRELALQINEEFKKLARGFKLFSVICVGGINIHPQIKSLTRQNHFIIGTPGRVLDLIQRKNLNALKVTTVVLDEADRMLDMGFIHDMKLILSSTPQERETLFFSATMSTMTEQLVKEFLHNPVSISVKKKDVTNSIKQEIISCDLNSKFETLKKLLTDKDFKRVIVFGSMKHSVEKLTQQLCSNNLKAESIHGNKNHSQRQRAFQKFKNGEAQILVATDVAARGIHIDDVTHVINYDLPQTFDDYVHRIGRTGRSTKFGKAITFVIKKNNF